MSKSDFENKGIFPKANKAAEDKPKKSGKNVKVKISPQRAVAGLGGPGDVVEVDPAEARRLKNIGYAEEVKDD